MSRKKNVKVLPPSWRPDLKEDIDLIEELVRIKGLRQSTFNKS